MTGSLKRARKCYFCRRPITKETKMHCDAPGCDVCATCREGRHAHQTPPAPGH